MEAFSETIEIQAPPERVWRALSTPAEVVCWDTGIVGPIDAPPDYPREGQHVRWRYRLAGWPLILHDRPTVGLCAGVARIRRCSRTPRCRRSQSRRFRRHSPWSTDTGFSAMWPELGLLPRTPA